MTFTKEQLQAVITGTDLNHRVEALRQLLGYPVKEHDPQGSRFWYLRPGVDELEAEETCPIAVGFYEELSGVTDQEIKKFLTSKEQQQEIYGHYTNRVAEQQPVMYLLLPTKEATGRVPLVLPSEGGLRQRQIQTFDWNEPQLIARLNRLKQGELPIAVKGLSSVPLVEWVFYEPIKTAKELAQSLAEAARRIEQVIPQVYEREKADGYLHHLLKSFQREILPKLKLTSENEKDYSFADIYAQTIAYALFTAKVFSHVKDKREGREKETHFDRESAWQQLPETNPFLRKLFQDVSERQPEELGDELIGAIAEIFCILRAAKMDAILSDFQMKMNREDIVIRFYEDFLTAYKPQMRERRGVYYTPEPVVSYMVRSVDILVKEKFNKPLGLADPEVMILDPACGTGTFLLWICQLIYQRFQESPEALTEGLTDKSWSSYVKERLLPRIFGFELLMAPYAIAHLKIGLFLQETGYQFDVDMRLGIYLSNALEQTAPDKPKVPFEEFIAQEGEAALEIKHKKPIMLIMGNPPYSPSNFEGTWIMNLMQDYKEGLSEKKSDLNREEWKFLRFAQEKIQNTGRGIISFVINNTFLDAITHRSLRSSLLQSFNEINIINLHGSIKKKEKSPDGSKDENVFDIQQGVGICFFTKEHQSKSFTGIKHSDLWGYRESKYNYLFRETIQSTNWMNLNPQPKHFFFVPKDFNLQNEYFAYEGLKNIFVSCGSGVKTERDKVSIHWGTAEIKEAVEDFRYLDEASLREKYQLQDDSRDWKIVNAKADVLTNRDDLVQPILYRLFDIRQTWYSGKTRGFIGTPGYPTMRHLLGNNLGMIAKRQARENLDYTWFFCCDGLVIDGSFAIDNKGRESIFPLYLYPDSRYGQQSILIEQRRPNLSQGLLNIITGKLGYTPTPEAIFYYIYAIFHSPTYRTRYAEFLKIDFPRVPLTSNNQLFTQLAEYGEELVALHLMKSPKLNNPITKFVENNGDCIVDVGHPKYTNGAVIINKKEDKFTLRGYKKG